MTTKDEGSERNERYTNLSNHVFIAGKFDEMKRDGLTEEKLYARHVLNIIKTVTDSL